MEEFPEDILQKKIFTYLNFQDLFYSVRGVNTHWAETMKDVYNDKMNMVVKHFIKITEHRYEKECLFKLIDKKTAYLDNYKSMILIYTENEMLSKSLIYLIDMLPDNKIKALYEFFLSFFILHDGKFLMDCDRSLFRTFIEDNDNIRHKIYYIISLDNDLECWYTIEKLNEFKNEFDRLDKSYLEDVCDASKIIYSYLSFVLVFLILKKEGIQERNRIKEIDNFLEKPSDWKEKQFFYEAIYKLVNFTSNIGTKIMLAEFEKVNINNPIQYTLGESETNYKGRLEKLIVPELLNNDKINTSYQNLINKRIGLTYKMLLLDDFYDFYKQFHSENNIIRIGEVEILMHQFLVCLLVIAKQGKKATEENILFAKKIMDGILNNKEVCPCCGDELESVPIENVTQTHTEEIEKKN